MGAVFLTASLPGHWLQLASPLGVNQVTRAKLGPTRRIRCSQVPALGTKLALPSLDRMSRRFGSPYSRKPSRMARTFLPERLLFPADNQSSVLETQKAF